MSGEAALYDYRRQRVYRRVENDWYVEPAWAVEALFDAERFGRTIWDPACGAGTILKVAAARRCVTFASDIVDRGYGRMDRIADFLDPAAWCVVNVAAIVCNPPYELAEQFARRALELVTEKVALLVQQQFPFSQKRYRLFTTTPLARLYFLSDRPSMPPGEALASGAIEAKGGKTDYLWMVWERGHEGPPTARWLRRRA